MRRILTAALAAVSVMASTLPLSQPSNAQTAYPAKPVTVIVAWPAGGATDLTTRAFNEAFGKALGVQTVIKNVVGAAGTIGTAEAADAAADGHTILVSPMGPIVLQPHRMKLTYDAPSFAPVCKMADTPILLMSPPNSRFKTAKEIADAAKAAPGKLAYASTGPGTATHIAMIAFAKAAGVQMKHVPFKGSAEVMQAMLAGTVEVFSDQPNLAAQYNMTPVAMFSEKRVKGFESTPTMKEQGINLTFSIWTAMFAPKATPEPVLAKLEAACKAGLEDPGVVAALEKQKQPISYLDRKGLAAFVASEYANAKALVAEAGLAKQ